MPSNISFWWISLDHWRQNKTIDMLTNISAASMTDTFEISVELRSITRCSRRSSAALGPMSFLLQSPRSQNINMIIICRQQNQFNTRSVFKPCYFVAILLVPALPAPAAAAATENPIGAADNLLKIFLISFVTK